MSTFMQVLFDEAAITRLINLGGDTLLLKIIEIFLTNIPPKVAACQENFAKGDLKAVEQEAHAIKSSAANLGLIRLSDFAAQIEKSAFREERETVSELMPLLNDAFEASLSLVKSKKQEYTH